MQLIEILKTATNAVLPIILLILFGYWLRQTAFISEEFAKTANKFVFRVCLSCSLFINVYNIRDFASVQWDFVIYLVAAVVVLFFVGMAVAVATTKEIKRRGAILHASFRSNFAIIGLSLAATLGGAEAETTAALAAAFIMPLYNIFGVIALTIFSDGQGQGKHTIKSALLSILKNPMIIGAIIGFVCLLLREVQKLVFLDVVFTVKENVPFLFAAVNNIKSITSPLALIVLGAQFKFSAVKGMLREISAGVVTRLILAPVICIGGAILLSKYTGLLNCGVNEYPTMIALFGSPAAVSSAVMAAEMGSDEQLATQIVVWSSIGSMLTIFVSVCILMAAGLLPV